MRKSGSLALGLKQSLRSPSESDGASPSQPGSGTFLNAPRARPMILIVDDNPIAVASLRDLLKRADYDVTTAKNGFEALALSKELRPDVVLLDIDMPDKSGIEVCAELKQNPKTWKTCIVLLTASDDPRHLRDGFRAGCDGYIAKGTGEDELLRKLSVKLLPGTSLQSRGR